HGGPDGQGDASMEPSLVGDGDPPLATDRQRQVHAASMEPSLVGDGDLVHHGSRIPGPFASMEPSLVGAGDLDEEEGRVDFDIASMEPSLVGDGDGRDRAAPAEYAASFNGAVARWRRRRAFPPTATSQMPCGFNGAVARWRRRPPAITMADV